MLQQGLHIAAALLLVAGLATGAYGLAKEPRAEEAPLYNVETFVPPQCYTKTDGDSNPCYVCHTKVEVPNYLDDVALQATYSFAKPALVNHWTNLFVDRREAMKRISEKEVDKWVRADNYSAWRKTYRPPAPDAYKPDLDLRAGFDAEGFDNGGTGWRAIRYAPFPGTFWPTNGSTDDVFIRLPEAFRQDTKGKPNREIYKANLAVIEASLKLPGRSPGEPVEKTVNLPTEPLNEKSVGADLVGVKKTSVAYRLHKLPERYFGSASSVSVEPGLYPEGTEFFHTVRYLDPAADGFMSKRMKEVRYAKKYRMVSPETLQTFFEEEFDAKFKGMPKLVGGVPGIGYRNGQGWILLGWIEDAEGKLRPQNNEEQRFCLGCHGSIGATRDTTFALPRKLPGADGWRPQSLSGMKDFPIAGSQKGHVATYFERVKAADEFRANAEMLERFFDKKGRPNATALKRVAVGGDKDLAWLLLPSQTRAYDLNRAYMLIVREQSFIRGRDAVVAPIANVHKDMRNGETENGAAQNVFQDGTLLLNFGVPSIGD